MKKKININIIVLSLLILSFIPLIVLGCYNKMCYDDYIFGLDVHTAWKNTGSVRETVIAAINQANERYMGWQGCWLVTFLTALYPANYNYNLAFIVPIVSIGLFAPAAFLVSKQMFTKWLGGDGKESAFVTVVMIFLFYQVMDSPFEGLYWYNGVTAYIFPQSFCFFAAAAITQLMCAEKGRKTVIWCVVSSVCAALGACGNYITTLQMEILIVFFAVYVFITEKRKLKAVLIPCLFGTLSFLLNVLAPGNMAREAAGGYTPYGPLMAIILSFYYSILFMIEWTPAIVLLVWIALTPCLWHIARNSEKSFKHPALVTFGAYSLLSAMFTPSLYAMGQAGLPRANNIIQIVYYLSILGVTTYLFGYVSHKKTDTVSLIGKLFEKTGFGITAGIMAVVLIIYCCTMDKNTYTSVSALRSVVKGEGRCFHEESMERYDLYQDETVRDVVVKPFSAKPALFHITDLSEDSGNWLNLSVAEYFGKDSVSVAANEND